MILNSPYDELLIGLENDEERLKSLFEFGVSIPNQELSYRLLKRITGQDYGYNVEAWKKWFENKDNEQLFYDNLMKSSEAKKSGTKDSS